VSSVVRALHGAGSRHRPQILSGGVFRRQLFLPFSVGQSEITPEPENKLIDESGDPILGLIRRHGSQIRADNQAEINYVKSYDDITKFSRQDIDGHQLSNAP
jgi:hypothetical protein